MSLNINQFIVAGNLTRDPELTNLPSNTQVAEFGIAVNRHYKDANGNKQESVDYFNCKAFGKQAETIGQYFRKGKPIFVNGRVQFEQWEDRDGGKRSKHVVVVQSFQFVPDGKRDGGGQPQNQQPQQRQQRPQSDGIDHGSGYGGSDQSSGYGYGSNSAPATGNQMTEDDIPF